MTEYSCDHPAVAKDYPFGYIQPPRKYTLLEEDAILDELVKYVPSNLPELADLRRFDAISFQPSPSETFPNEDRFHATTVPLDAHPDKSSANLFIVLDGHSSPRCVTHAAQHLPAQLEQAIRNLPASAWTGPHSSSDPIACALADGIQAYDTALLASFTAAVPAPEQLAGLSDEEIRALVERPEVREVALRAASGSTALVVLQVGREVWTATIGDCEAVVGTKAPGAGEWETAVIHGGPHNPRTNPKEKAKLVADHPGEDIVVAKNRVLGLIAVSRAFGDAMFKLPLPYLRIMTEIGLRNSAKLKQLMDTYKSPPYLTATAETVYHRVPDDHRAFLILCTDGLENPEFPFGNGEMGEVAVDPEKPDVQEKAWVAAVGKRLDAEAHDGAGGPGVATDNLALRLVRDLWGQGETGRHLASAFVNLDYKEDHYVDDTTVLVAVLE